MKEIKVMLITHLPHIRRFAQNAVGKERGFALVSSATNLMEGFSKAEEEKPNLALVSADFIRLAEFEMVRTLFSALDIRWLVVTDGHRQKSALSGSMTRGSGIFSVDIDDGEQPLLRSLRSLANFPQGAAKSAASLGSEAPAGRIVSPSDSVVLIGSSTGGVDALTEVLSQFPRQCPPTFIVQHTGSSFGESLARLLNGRCSADVVTARHGLSVTSGMVCLGAGQKSHLHVTKTPSLSCRMKSGPPVSGHLPSVDELFRSALPFASRVVACLLTGMGRDGAEGLLDLRKAGARTFVQDEGSSVVYGMPKAAWELGAAERRVPITKMADTIFEACNRLAQPKRAASR